MMARLQPSCEQNIATRMFLRFFIAYFLLILPVLALVSMLSLPVSLSRVGSVQFWFVPLSLLGGFLTICKPYLLVLTAFKAYYDTALIHSFFGAFRSLERGFWVFNATLAYLIFSVLLFCVSSSKACLFSTGSSERDSSLLFSAKCLHFLTECALICALSLTLYYLWPQLAALF